MGSAFSFFFIMFLLVVLFYLPAFICGIARRVAFICLNSVSMDGLLDLWLRSTVQNLGAVVWCVGKGCWGCLVLGLTGSV